MPTGVVYQEGDLLRSLLEVGVNLSVVKDQRTMLEMILREARKLTHAEAGTLYVLQNDLLKFVAVQNDKLRTSEIDKALLDKELPMNVDSLAGFAAKTGETINIPDTQAIADGSPFQMYRDFCAKTGYRVESSLVIPLNCPDGLCVGVLQMMNCLDGDGQVVAFPDEDNGAITSLASMAAVTIHNSLLKQQLKRAQLDCIIRLSVAAEFRDDDTSAHIQRISGLSKLIADTLGMDSEQVELIEYASPMHDIGKIGIPDVILLKPGPLTFEEKNIVEKHTVIGADILGPPTNKLIETARDVALTHHERWDGGGYPHGLSNDEIPLFGRIVALADVFDALVSKRCYKEAFTLEIAREIVRFEEGKHFDPEVSSAFLSQLSEAVKLYDMALID